MWLHSQRIDIFDTSALLPAGSNSASLHLESISNQHTDLLANTSMYAHAYAHTYIRSHIHTLTHTYAHTYIRSHIHTLTLFLSTKHNTQSYGICTRASTFSNSLYVVDVQMVQKRMQLPAVMRLTVSPNSHRNILTLLAPLLSIDEYVVSLHCYLLDPFFLSSQLHIVCYVNYYAHSFRLSCLPNVKMNMTFS